MDIINGVKGRRWLLEYKVILGQRHHCHVTNINLGELSHTLYKIYTGLKLTWAEPQSDSKSGDIFVSSARISAEPIRL